MKNTEVSLCLRSPCNYSCEYCIGERIQSPVVEHDLSRLSKIYQSIGAFIFTVFECKAGEPTVHPQLKDILTICKDYGTISMPTNNSIKPNKWLPKSCAKSMLLNITLHPQAEEEIDGFTDRLTEIKEMGSEIHLRYIARPDRIKRLLALVEYFNKKGFKIQGVPFNGIYEGKHYPDSYSKYEKLEMGLDERSYWYSRLEIDMKIRNFKGIPCLAGYSLFNIGPSTTLRKCLYDLEPLDSPRTEAQPCRVTSCGCGCYLKELNVFTPSYWNYVRGLSGYTLMDADNRTNDQLYQEAHRIYWDLMGRYNKTPENT